MNNIGIRRRGSSESTLGWVAKVSPGTREKGRIRSRGRGKFLFFPPTTSRLSMF